MTFNTTEICSTHKTTNKPKRPGCNGILKLVYMTENSVLYSAYNIITFSTGSRNKTHAVKHEVIKLGLRSKIFKPSLEGWITLLYQTKETSATSQMNKTGRKN